MHIPTARRARLAILATSTLALLCSIGACANTSAPAPTPEPEARFESFDRAKFSDSTTIDNEWMPLEPGMRFVYEGTTVDDGEVLPHRVEIHVTDLVKVIDGVKSRVSWDLDYSEGELVEAELAFFAQDDDGTVWRMGEHPEEYEDGELLEAPTWISGIAGAYAGISMLAKPAPGTRSYSQGWAPGVGFTDRGRVDRTGETVQVPAGTYDDVLVIAESSAEEGPDAEQLKFFARGVGNVRVGWRGAGETTQEVLELVAVEKLGPAQMDEVRRKAFELEKSAYEVSQDVYAKTPPAVHLPAGERLASTEDPEGK